MTENNIPVEEIDGEAVEQLKQQEEAAFNLREFFKSAPRALKRKIAPERKFAATFLEKMRQARQDSK